MKKIILSGILLLVCCANALAQNHTIQIKIVSSHENEPLVEATVYFTSIKKGIVTNNEGLVQVTDLPQGEYPVEVSYLGFETLKTTVSVPTKEMLKFSLGEEKHHLESIVLQSTRSSRTIRNIPTRIEFIGGEELGEKNMMNPTNISMVLRESTGIQMQQTSLSSGNANIRIQGLDGRYTQLLRDGFPLYGGFSSGLSLMQIPPLDLQQFEIIKGSASTLYGAGAIAGLVNLISKKPKAEPALDLMFTQTHALGSTGNVYYSQRTKKWGVSVYTSAHYQKEYDPENDDFSNLPKIKSIGFNPKVYYYPSEETTIWLGINSTFENRIGGDMKYLKNEGDDTHAYFEENLTKRIGSQFSMQTKVSEKSRLTFKNSVSYFDRELNVPNLSFKGEEINSFTELNYQIETKKHDLVVGTNLYTSAFEERQSDKPRDQKETTFGGFVNHTYDFNDQWILESGFRTDYNSDYGLFPLPRVSLLYRTPHGFSTRIGGGLGYKLPTMFTSEAESIHFRGVQPIEADKLDAEKSYGVNFDLNYKTKWFNTVGVSINQLFYVSSIDNSVLLYADKEQNLRFKNASDKVFSKGSETNLKFSYKDFKWFLNYAFIDVRLDYLPDSPKKPLTARHNAGSVLMYENETWRIGLETYYTGTQKLSNGTETEDFVLLGFLISRNFPFGSVFMNFENLTDRRQSRFSDLVLPPHRHPNFPEIYAPTDGFIFSAGIIIKPFGAEHHH